MAEQDSTLQSRSSQVNSPNTRILTVLETVVDAPTKVRSIGITYVPVQLEPCILLRGKWLRELGFEVGQKVTVYAEHNLLKITVNFSFDCKETEESVGGPPHARS